MLPAGLAYSAIPDDLSKIAARYDNCQAAATATVSIKQCNADAYTEVDIVLNENYQFLINKLTDKKVDEFTLKDNAEVLRRLKTAQRAWVPYRDAQCELEASASLGGTNEGVIFGSCLYRLTVERVNALNSQFFSDP
jgi:uncharacterized protein YecT (DUF1311 family)